MNLIYKLAYNYVIKQHQKFLRDPKKGERLSFKQRHLPNIDFTQARIDRSDFTKAQIKDSNFFAADMGKGKFCETYMSYSDFSRASMQSTKFNETDMYLADISTAILRKATHQIHIRNRQKEDLEAMQKQAQQLWAHMKFLEDNSHDKDIGGLRHDLLCFLRNNQVRRPSV